MRTFALLTAIAGACLLVTTVVAAPVSAPGSKLLVAASSAAAVELEFENYQLDTTRTPDQSDKTFVIDSGIP